MKDRHQTDNFDDELLSAYVDGELTGDELAQVEQRLADDPQARQLVEELRALSQEMRSLPQEKVGEDLRATVIQRAERAMLLGTEEQRTLPPAESGSSRRWLWATMALAATLLLTAYLPNAQQEEKPLASAKPALADQPRTELRLEAADQQEEQAVVAANEEVVQAEKTARLEGEQRAGKAIESEETFAFRAGEAMSAPSVAANETLVGDLQPTCQIQITLNDRVQGVQRFDQLLALHGIDLLTGKEQSKATDAESDSEDDKTAGRIAVQSRPLQPLQSGQQSVPAELVWVEAPLERIENMLAACHADTATCESVLVVAEQEATTLPLARWRQLQRQGKLSNLGKQKARKRTAEFKSASQSQRGTARRLDPNRYQDQGNGQRGFEPKRLDPKSKVSSKTPVQVLFILQQAPGEPASADGDPIPAR